MLARNSEKDSCLTPRFLLGGIKMDRTCPKSLDVVNFALPAKELHALSFKNLAARRHCGIAMRCVSNGFEGAVAGHRVFEKEER
jgi:hypothetical protein